MSTHEAARRIRRYGNRKLYDADAKRYVTLEDLAALISDGHELEVTDQRTGEDTTSLTLAQVLLEGLKERTARIPRQVLVRLIRLSAGAGSAWPDWVGPQEAAARARGEVEKIVGSLLARGRLTLEEGMALRQDVARSVHGIVADAQSGVEGRVRGLFGAFGPRPPRPRGPANNGTRARAGRGARRRRTA
ncbi:MAG TPA: polyhydroxyalkanoate synthesis regulator DNA-binding domain-containing protein [Vicinamibacteria bacterium]|nr:polyhydroxyalkanoate synthesis regulator DNA-binding domain-containing protein [Vicinamibacteria bacterium]